MASSNQGGSILSFLVVGGVLVALLIGGAYFVQQRAESSPSSQPPVVQPVTQPSDQADKKATPATDDNKIAADPQKEEAKKETPQQSTPQAATPPASELPKTGPTETAMSIIGAGLLSGMTVAYVRSRRSRVTL